MTEQKCVVFLYQKDFSEQGGDRYFICNESKICEVSANELVEFSDRLITHDFWLIAPSIQNSTGKLPNEIVDIFEIEHAMSGCKLAARAMDRIDLKSIMGNFLEKKIEVDTYTDIYYRKTKFDLEVYKIIGSALLLLWVKLLEFARAANEYQRYFDIEIKVFNYLWRCAAKGIRIDSTLLRKHKESIDNEYYLSLKAFGTKFNQSFEMPSDTSIEKYLVSQNFDFSGVSIDYVLGFLPIINGYGIDLKRLRKIHKSRGILADMPLSIDRALPIVDIAGTVTSRIIYRNPALQNLAKRYRNIFIADPGKSLGYVDFAQFEVGIMVFLSNDPFMRELYETGDLYTRAAIEIFETADKRKDAKRLFLSFAYGMSLKQLADAASAEGAVRRRASEFFRRFEVFDKWRREVADAFFKEGRIGTALGNYAVRVQSGVLSSKERRSCVSQVVQGTASLIFKKVLIALSQEPQVEVLIPMHDAVFFQHPTEYDVRTVQKIFEVVFQDHFDGAIQAQATIGTFAE